MADATTPLERLEDEMICVVCMGYFREPVILSCGHNFCEACIVGFWGKGGPEPFCPRCEGPIQHKNFQYNLQLARMVDIAKELYAMLAKKGEGGSGMLCKRHLEPLKFFCEEEEDLICVVCRESQDHKAHPVLPVEEAAQERKGQTQKHLEVLKVAADEIVGFLSTGKEEGENMLNQTKVEIQAVQVVYRDLHKFLVEEERVLVSRLEKLNKEIVKKQDKYVAELAEELSLRDGFIQEMDEKCKQPAEQFLQDFKITLKRCEEKNQEKFENPVAFRPSIKQKIIEIACLLPVIKNVMDQFKDRLASTRHVNKAETVTLDPETLHPGLELSEDQKCVRWATEWQVLPSSALRFNSEPCVLGSCGYTSGKHFWVVEIEKEEGGWALGVAKEPINKKGLIRLSSDAGVWSLLFNGISYCTLSSPFQTLLKLPKKPTKVQVGLDFEKEQVVFMDADTKALIFAYVQSTLSGQKLYPWFKVGNGSVLRIMS